MIIEAILKINPNAKVSVNAEDINQITWLEGTTPIPVADIQAQFPAVELDIFMVSLRDITNGVTTVEQANAVVFPTKP